MLDQGQNHHRDKQGITDLLGMALRLINPVDETKGPDHRNRHRNRKQHVHRFLVQKALHHIHMRRNKLFADIADTQKHIEPRRQMHAPQNNVSEKSERLVTIARECIDHQRADDNRNLMIEICRDSMAEMFDS